MDHFVTHWDAPALSEGAPISDYTAFFAVVFRCRLSGLDSDGYHVHIQMVSALVLQLIQCVVRLPLSDGNGDAKVGHFD